MSTNILPIFFDRIRSEKKLQDWLHKPVLSQQNSVDAIAQNCTHQLRQAKARRGAPPVNLREMIRYAADYIDSFKAGVSADISATGAVPEFVAEKFTELIGRKELLGAQHRLQPVQGDVPACRRQVQGRWLFKL